MYEKQEKEAARADIRADQVIRPGELAMALQESDFIFNTIPAMVLPKALLGYVRRDALILDMASAPGGVDYEACKEDVYKRQGPYGPSALP